MFDLIKLTKLRIQLFRVGNLHILMGEVQHFIPKVGITFHHKGIPLPYFKYNMFSLCFTFAPVKEVNLEARIHGMCKF